MVLLHKVSKFTSRISDLKLIYNSKIRSILETSCVVWHSSITMQQRASLERLQKTAFRIILKYSYESYDNALRVMNMNTLHNRREKLCLRFAKSSLRHKRMRSMFPVNTTSHSMMRGTRKVPSHICRECWMMRIKNYKEWLAVKALISV